MFTTYRYVLKSKQTVGVASKRLQFSILVKDENLELYKDHLKIYHEVISESEEKEIIEYLNPILARKRYEGNHWDDVIAKYKEVELSSHIYKVPENVKKIFEKVETFIELALERSEEKGNKMDFLAPHVIDLAKEGHIAPHVDSIKFSGDLVAGLSLKSIRTMELSLDTTTLTSATLADNNLSSSSSSGMSNKKSSTDDEGNTNKMVGSNSNSGSNSGSSGSGSGGGSSSGRHVSVVTTSLPPNYPKVLHFALPPRSLYLLTGPMRYNYAHAIFGIKTQPTVLPTASDNRPSSSATVETKDSSSSNKCVESKATDSISDHSSTSSTSSNKDNITSSSHHYSSTVSSDLIDRRLSVIFRNTKE